MLLRIWSDEMESAQFEEIYKDIQPLHKAMKNAIEMVFATSPLLALSTNSWGGRTVNSTFLLRVGDFYVLSFPFVDDPQGLPSPWQRPPSNPRSARGLCYPSHYIYFRGKTT